MPYARIEVPAGLPATFHDAILDGIDGVFVEVLGVPPQDAFLRLFEYRPGMVRVPRCHGAKFCFVEVQLFPGRSAETKARLYRMLADCFVAQGVPASDVTIALVEIATGDWGVRGGLSAAEVEHGFHIAV